MARNGFNPRWIAGKTVARVIMHPFRARPDAPNDKTMAHDPTIHFTDGSYIFFTTEETETGEYGTTITYIKAK